MRVGKAKGGDLRPCPLLPLALGPSDLLLFPCSFIHSLGK